MTDEENRECQCDVNRAGQKSDTSAEGSCIAVSEFVHSNEMSHRLNRSVIDSDVDSRSCSIDVKARRRMSSVARVRRAGGKHDRNGAQSLDASTSSGVRAALFDERGNECPEAVGRRSGEFRLCRARSDRLVDEVVKTIDELLAITSLAGRSICIAISAFWHSLIGIDAAGRPTTPLLTWADTRAAQFANDLRSQFNEREIHARTGCRFHPSYWPAKLRWLQARATETISQHASAGLGLLSIFACGCLAKRATSCFDGLRHRTVQSTRVRLGLGFC